MTIVVWTWLKGLLNSSRNVMALILCYCSSQTQTPADNFPC